MNAKIKHAKLKGLVTAAEIRKTQSCSTPFMAARQVVLLKDAARSCALLDSMDPLTAAFIVHILREWAQYEAGEVANLSQAIIVLGERLKIQGLKGLCHARDEIYKRTGAFIA
jgi:hypothetical protein